MLLAVMVLGGASSVWAEENTDANGRKQYVWNFGCEAKAAVNSSGTGTTTYYLKYSESTYNDSYSSSYGTSGNYDIAKVVVYDTRSICSSASPGGKGAGVELGYNAGYIEFYAPVTGYVTLVGTYLSGTNPNISIKNTTQSNTTVTGNNALAVTAGDIIRVYVSKSGNTNTNGAGVEKVVVTETYFGETLTNPSMSVTDGSMTITSGTASWTAGGVGTSTSLTKTSEDAAIISVSVNYNPAVTTYYTTDGTTPSTSNGTAYSDAFSVGTTSVVKCISVSESGSTSEVVTTQANPNAVSSATTWDLTSSITKTDDLYYDSDKTLFMGTNFVVDGSNGRYKFTTVLADAPSYLGDNVVSFKAGADGYVVMKIACYTGVTIAVTDNAGSEVATITGSANTYHQKEIGFRVASGKQYYIRTTAFGGQTAGIYYIKFDTDATNLETLTPATVTFDSSTRALTLASAGSHASMTEGATLAYPAVKTYYTIDGSTPTAASTELTSSATIDGEVTTIKVITIGLGSSEVTTLNAAFTAVSEYTKWDFSSLSFTKSTTDGQYLSDYTLYVGANTNRDASNGRAYFEDNVADAPTAVGANMISFKTAVAGQVIIKLSENAVSTIKVSDGTSDFKEYATTSASKADSQDKAGFHGGNNYYKLATFQATAGTQYYIHATSGASSSNKVGVFYIEFQPTGNNTTTALTEETTWDFGTQNDILTEFHGVTKDNMYFGEGTTNVLSGSNYRIQFSGNGNTSTGANLISFKVPANVCGTVTVQPSCATDNIVLSDGTSTLKTFTSTDDNTEVAVPVTTTSETTLYLYTPSYTTAGTGIYKVVWTPVTEVSATIGTNGYATFASPYPLDLTTANMPEGLTAYKAAVSGTTVTFTLLNQTVPANTGILLQGEASGLYDIPVVASGTEVTENAFLVNTGGTTFAGDEDYYYFGLKKNTLTFGTFTPGTLAIPANKAYLKVAKSNFGGGAARELSFSFGDDETTRVETMNHALGSAALLGEEPITVNQYYDLQGRRVAQPTRGLYIVNGKKVVVK